MTFDTSMGGARKRFPETRLSLVLGTGDPDPDVRQRALEILIASYWKPVYKCLRIQWRASNEDAKDLTQGFFASLLESQTLSRFDPARARFRTFLRTCLDRYVSNQRKAAGRLKRGGGFGHVPLDFEGAEGELRHVEVAVDADPDALFHREWVRSMISRAVEELRTVSEASGRGIEFELFHRYDIEGPEQDPRPTYAGLATALGIDVTRVTNALHAARGRFRAILLDLLREASVSEAEFRADVTALLEDGRS
jgi:DNA-directed RNA polymerase specialized sigma24 family protein